jgi:F-type H+-transporting ATPase subunit gamma
MANTRAILKRRKAVRNIHKITRTMNLIATSKFRRAHDRAVASRPYTEKVTELVNKLAEATATDGDEESATMAHPLLKSRPVENDLLLVLTSNRGLCGGYNAAILRTALGHLREQKAKGVNVHLEVAGKKGINYLKFVGREMDETYTHIEDKPTWEDAEWFVDRYRAMFEQRGEIDAVNVAYMKFFSAGRQEPVVEQLLPFGGIGEMADQAEPGQERRHPLDDFDFSPEPEQLLGELIPVAVKVRLLQFFFDAAVSEQVARMTAMKAATDNAADMIKTLTQQYNRARQTQITTELLDILGGAEALQ